MTRKKKIVIGSLIPVVIAIIVIANLKRGTGEEIKVQVEKAERDRIVQMVSATGKIRPITEVNISANVSAKIMELGVEEGDMVEKGQFLVQLDKTKYQAAVDQAEANMRSALANAKLSKANLEVTRSELKRFKLLYAKQFKSKADFESMKARLEVNEAQYEAALEAVSRAKAVLDEAKDALSKTRLYSPMSGTVSKLNKEVGEIALGSQFQEDIIMKIADLSRMKAVVEVDENDVVDVSLGDTAFIKVDAFPDTTFMGIVSKIANTATTRGFGTQEEVTNFEVEISMESFSPRLRPGMSASVDIQTEVKKDVVVVPIQCVTVREPRKLIRKEGLEEENRPAEGDKSGDKEDELVEVVFVVNGNVAEMRRVKTGISSKTHIEIVEGLKEGEVVVSGSYKALSKELKDGSKVKIEKKKI